MEKHKSDYKIKECADSDYFHSSASQIPSKIIASLESSIVECIIYIITYFNHDSETVLQCGNIGLVIHSKIKEHCYIIRHTE